MIGIAVACVGLTIVLMSLLRMKRGTLGRWQVPLFVSFFLKSAALLGRHGMNRSPRTETR